MTTKAYPLAWPAGWRRIVQHNRKRAQFGVSEYKSYAGGGGYNRKRALSIADGIKRVRVELDRLGVDAANDAIISTNLRLNLSGMPRGDQGEPPDPGVAVYWQKPGAPMRVMAVDAYDRVADNLGAIAATLEAMRAIERHGGAQILDRAFAGFDALPPPKDCWQILGLERGSSATEIRDRHRKLVGESHPDRGGSGTRAAEVNAARDAALQEIGAT